MRINYHKNFKKSFSKLSVKNQEEFRRRIELFAINQFDQQLNNHPLKGKYTGYRSINIAGDLCAAYKLIDNEIYFFVEIGTHSEIYS